MLKVAPQVATPGAESAVYDCLVVVVVVGDYTAAACDAASTGIRAL